MRKNLLYSVVTAVCLFGSMFNAAAYDFSGGDGTSGNPYQVATKVDFDSVRRYTGTTYRGACFKQTANIDLGTLTSPSGTFYGNYNGNGYKLSNISMSVTPSTATATTYGSLFAAIGGGATIENVHLEGGTITVSSDETYTGSVYAGGIVGYIYNDGGGNTVVRNCSNTATITNNARGGVYAGGIVGQALSYNTDGSSVLISNCYSNAAITATGGTTTTYYVGGIAGCARIYYATSGQVTIDKCFSTGAINVGTSTAVTTTAAGIVGRIMGSTSKEPGVQPVTISNCVSALEKIESNSTYAYRIYASRTTNDSLIVTPNYAYAGMLVKGATVSGANVSGATGLNKTIDELHAKATYEALGWDFDTIWTIEEGVSFPQLKTGGSTGTQFPKAAGALTASASKGMLTVKGLVAGETLSVYNLMGQLLVKRKATRTEETVGLPAAGIYLISSGNQTVKTISK